MSTARAVAQADQAAQLVPLAGGSVRIVFDRPQRAVTPGQYVVAYEGGRCLGGAVIERVAPGLERASSAAA